MSLQQAALQKKVKKDQAAKAGADVEDEEEEKTICGLSTSLFKTIAIWFVLLLIGTVFMIAEEDLRFDEGQSCLLVFQCVVIVTHVQLAPHSLVLFGYHGHHCWIR
jgi:hypothetical protein